jgi:hypothetical protein
MCRPRSFGQDRLATLRWRTVVEVFVSTIRRDNPQLKLDELDEFARARGAGGVREVRIKIR